MTEYASDSPKPLELCTFCWDFSWEYMESLQWDDGFQGVVPKP